MIQEIKNIRLFYKGLGSNTRLVIRVTLITVFTLLCTAIFTYSSTDHPLYYEFLSTCDELLNVTKSVAAVGFVGALGINCLEANER